jgi:hypothetical protein
MKILSWNCRGLGLELKGSRVRQLIKLEKPYPILLLEMKLSREVFLEIKEFHGSWRLEVLQEAWQLFGTPSLLRLGTRHVQIIGYFFP